MLEYLLDLFISNMVMYSKTGSIWGFSESCCQTNLWVIYPLGTLRVLSNLGLRNSLVLGHYVLWQDVSIDVLATLVELLKCFSMGDAANDDGDPDDQRYLDHAFGWHQLKKNRIVKKNFIWLLVQLTATCILYPTVLVVNSPIELGQVGGMLNECAEGGWSPGLLFDSSWLPTTSLIPGMLAPATYICKN